MRLGQMARKLGVSQAEIVSYLSSQNMQIEEGSNVKLGEPHIHLLYARFAPSAHVEKPVENERVAESTPDNIGSVDPGVRIFTEDSGLDLADENETAEAPVEMSTSLPAPLPETEATSTAPLHAAQSDTIRVPKIELAGLKVIGKIELPEPKKKDAPPTEDSIKTGDPLPDQVAGGSNPRVEAREDGRRERERSGNRTDGQDDRRRARNNQPREKRPYKNPIAAQREREIEAELERRKQKAAEDKERRTQNYQKRVKHSPPTKAARIIEEQVEELSAEALNERPASWFGKFVQWLRK